MIFVDTSAWFAAFVPNDPNHAAAKAWRDRNNELLITSDYVLDELLTLLKVRGEYHRAIPLGEAILRGALARFEWITPADVERAWLMFHQYRDKQWSFTDCTSRALMQRLSITSAFALDEHFRQFGDVAVLPS